MASIAKLEDITGPRKPSEERPKVPVDADTSDMLLERRRTVTEQEPKPPRWSQSECDALTPNA